MSRTICDPFTNLPIKFDIRELVKEFQPEVEGGQVDEDKTPRDFLHQPDENWVVLPSFKYQLEHLVPYLSCRSNPYMRCRYRKFLDNVPSSYVTISVYGSNISNMPKPRRKSLNGQFYGVDNKLAPIPVVADPRSPPHRN